MTRLLILLHLHLTHLVTQPNLQRRDRRPDRRRDQRGSVTIEQVIWAVALIAIVAIVVTAIRTFVIDKAGQIQ